jgi:hypothetical protein
LIFAFFFFVMADVVALRAALTRMGLTAAAAQNVTDVQGMDPMEEFSLLTDQEAENFCKTIRRPGGTIPNPALPVGGASPAGMPPTIPNPGIPVNLRAENNLKLMCYFLLYRRRTSRPVAAGDITLNNVRALQDHRDWENKHENVEPPTINGKDWPKTIEAIQEWLRGTLGENTKLPLAYVIRHTTAVMNDPPDGWPTRVDELIGRVPILDAAGGYTQDFLADRTHVWELMSDLTRSHECCTYVRPAQRTRDGRLAFTGLKGHYLGENMVDNQAMRPSLR